MDDLFLTTGVWIYDPPFFFGPTVRGNDKAQSLFCVEMLLIGGMRLPPLLRRFWKFIQLVLFNVVQKEDRRVLPLLARPLFSRNMEFGRCS